MILRAQLFQVKGLAVQGGDILGVGRQGALEVGLGVFMLAALGQQAGQVAVDPQVVGQLVGGIAQCGFGLVQLAELYVGEAQRRVGMGIVRLGLGAGLERRHRLFGTPHLRQTDAVVVEDLGVVDHLGHDLECRQCVLQEAMLEQAQNVLLGLDTFLRHRDAQHVSALDDDRSGVTLGRVLQGDGMQDGIFKARGISRRQAIDLDIVEAAFEDFGGLGHCVTCESKNVCCGQWYQGILATLEEKDLGDSTPREIPSCAADLPSTVPIRAWQRRCACRWRPLRLTWCRATTWRRAPGSAPCAGWTMRGLWCWMRCGGAITPTGPVRALLSPSTLGLRRSRLQGTSAVPLPTTAAWCLPMAGSSGRQSMVRSSPTS